METVTLSSAHDRSKLNDVLQNFAQTHQVPSAAISAIDLALEEHLANIFNYGYETGGNPEVVVRLERRQTDFLVEISDNGKAFNPLDHPEPDIKRPLEERPIGGLGIHLIRKFVDQLSYRREAGRNVLTMLKRVAG